MVKVFSISKKLEFKSFITKIFWTTANKTATSYLSVTSPLLLERRFSSPKRHQQDAVLPPQQPSRHS